MGYSVTITLCVCSARTRRNIRLGVDGGACEIKKNSVAVEANFVFFRIFVFGIGRSNWNLHVLETKGILPSFYFLLVRRMRTVGRSSEENKLR